MAAHGIDWSPEDSLIVQDGIDKGLTPNQIRALVPSRSRSSVISRMRTLGFYTPPSMIDASAQTPHERNMRGDAKFKKAMVAAIRVGAEAAPMGTFKDYRALIPTHFAQVIRFSGCGSSALECVEAAGSASRAIAPRLGFA